MRWPWSVPERDALLDVLITPPVPKFTGHDEALAIRTVAKRAQAEKARRAARRLETRSEAPLDARERHGMRRVH